MPALPWSRVKKLQYDFNERLTPEDHETAGGFLHFCDEWDGLLIDRTDDEFGCCSCLFAYPDYCPFTGKSLPPPIR